MQARRLPDCPLHRTDGTVAKRLTARAVARLAAVWCHSLSLQARTTSVRKTLPLIGVVLRNGLTGFPPMGSADYQSG